MTVGRATPPQSGLMLWLGSVLQEGRDQSTLQYKRNRYYDPAIGRFTQSDPIGLAGGLNAYGFAGGDPVNYMDPFGLCPPKTMAEVAMCTGQLLQPVQRPLEIAGTLITAPLAGGSAIGEIGTEVVALGRTLEVGGGGILTAAAVAQRVAGATGGTVSRLSQSPGFKVTVSGARDIVARIKATGEMRVGIDGIGALTREGLVSSNRALTHLKNLSSADLTDLVNIAKQFLNVPK